MKCNVGKEDAFWRTIAGITLGIVGWYFREWWGLLGLVLVATALFCFCPLYKLFGISTFKQGSDWPDKKNIK